MKFNQWFIILSDDEIRKAAILHGLKTHKGFFNGVDLVFKVIPQSFGGRLIKYYRQKNKFGSSCGRWLIAI